MNSSNKKPKTTLFVDQLAKDFPQYRFKPGKQEHWSPRTRTIIYNPDRPIDELKQSLLHELSHALLEHKDYSSDFELLKLESQAWSKAAELAPRYSFTISEEHIQDCLDTYRDWLHRRSTCPVCGMHVIQASPSTYRCFNCQTEWTVTGDRFVRSYRKLA